MRPTNQLPWLGFKVDQNLRQRSLRLLVDYIYIYIHIFISTFMFQLKYLTYCIYIYTLPKFNSLTARQKNDAWKTFLLGWYIFRGYVKLPGGIYTFKTSTKIKKSCLKKDPNTIPHIPKHSMRPTSCLYVYLQMYKQIDQPPLSV